MLHEAQTKPDFQELRNELKHLLRDFDMVGRGVSTAKHNMDMIALSICHVDQLGPMGECTKVALLEPLVALAVRSFLAAVDGQRRLCST
jgi:hypothetical protein